MAAITHTGASATTTNALTYATAAFTPAVGDLLVFLARVGATADAGTVSNSAGLTFTKIDHATFSSSLHRIYAFVSDSFATAVSQTCTISLGASDAGDGAVRCVARISGMSKTGATAVRQSAKLENQSTGTPAPVFGVAALTTNPLIALMGNLANPATMTAPSGWTEQLDSGYSTPDSGLEYATIDSGFTGTTVTWGSASGTHGAMAIEFDASSAALPALPYLVAARR